MVHIREKMKEGKVVQFYLNNKVTCIIFSNSQYFSKNRGVLRFSFNRIASTRNIRNNSFVMYLARPRQSFYLHTRFHMLWKNIQHSIKKNRRQALFFENYRKHEKTIFAVVLVTENRKSFPPFWQLCALVPIGLVNRKSAWDYSVRATMQFHANRTSADVILEVFVEKQRYVRLSRNFRSFRKETTTFFPSCYSTADIFISTKWVVHNSIK